MYSKKWLSADFITGLFRPVYRLLSRKYWLDELYEDVVGDRLLNRGLFGIMQSLKYIVDGP
jgi:hypothetical protein